MIHKHFRQSDRKKEPTRAAVIRYDKEKDNAPVVVAQGRGDVARKIIEKAKESNIALQEDAFLLDNLFSLDLGNQVPPQLYQVVAEILLLVRRANIEETGVSQAFKPISVARSVRDTVYWNEAEEEDEEDISLEDLLGAIKNI
ncbi:MULTISPECIES: EscU/YscU/HrcU family type III secretion system export apparatus switch protein [Aneurinibacillus]|uniref:EscU/YscU/HrcU family type III secretion system export apparatus switch protein n=1 Tax=Aneurinibacillus TaxID=55079 RepID=UPI0006A225E0|nr:MULTISPECIES: EscU/YscU/HrcU family type III secretion system export apparatus switch protein [Aneurinibacillus]CEH30577.1 Putative FlhB domain protein [Aneurinibacillus migulanus]